MRSLILATILLALTLAGAAHAGDIALSLVGSLDGGPTWGAALSYPVADVGGLDLWADLGLKRADTSTAALLGLSTPAVPLLSKLPVLRSLVDQLDDDFPANARIGGGLLSTGEPLAYLAYSLEF